MNHLPFGLVMLLRFGIENHLSICDYQEISCAASSLKDEPSHLLQMKTRGDSVKQFVPLVALYGANAAGKSNMIGGLRFLFSAVTASYDHWRKKKTLPHTPCKIHGDGENRTSLYDCDVLIGEVRYHYGFEISKEGFVAEWLHSYPHGLKKVLLKRDFREPEGQQIYFGPSVTKLNPSLHELARDTKTLFLSVSGAVTHEAFTPVFTFFKESMVIITPSAGRPQQQIAEELADDQVREAVEAFLEKADFGIGGVKIVSAKVDSEQVEFRKKLKRMLSELVEGEVDFNVDDEEKEIYFVHKCGDNRTFEVSQARESTGTKHLLSMLAPILSALKTGKTVVIDEITTTLHTKLSEELIKLFASPETNTNNAQFIFSTHDTNLLSCPALRRDEIWFAEKDSQGRTSIYPLSDFQTRKADNLERGYLQGRFGAVPFFGDFSSLFSAN